MSEDDRLRKQVLEHIQMFAIVKSLLRNYRAEIDVRLDVHKDESNRAVFVTLPNARMQLKFVASWWWPESTPLLRGFDEYVESMQGLADNHLIPEIVFAEQPSTSSVNLGALVTSFKMEDQDDQSMLLFAHALMMDGPERSFRGQSRGRLEEGVSEMFEEFWKNGCFPLVGPEHIFRRSNADNSNEFYINVPALSNCGSQLVREHRGDAGQAVTLMKFYLALRIIGTIAQLTLTGARNPQLSHERQQKMVAAWEHLWSHLPMYVLFKADLENLCGGDIDENPTLFLSAIWPYLKETFPQHLGGVQCSNSREASACFKKLKSLTEVCEGPTDREAQVSLEADEARLEQQEFDEAEASKPSKFWRVAGGLGRGVKTTAQGIASGVGHGIGRGSQWITENRRQNRIEKLRETITQNASRLDDVDTMLTRLDALEDLSDEDLSDIEESVHTTLVR